MATKTTTEQPCNKFKRDGCGLIEGVEYQYNEDNTVNWRAMVKPEYLVINRQYKDKVEELTGKKFEEINPLDLEDKYLLILLAGLKELAKIRGYTKVRYCVAGAHRDYAATTCRITWIPNYETGGNEVEFEALADASTDNTSGWAANYLMAIAENRAFVRCVRSYLGIYIVGQDEINMGEKNPEPAVEVQSNKPHLLLEKKLAERGKTFDQFKNNWAKLGHPEAKDWNVVTDIPVEQIWAIFEAMKNKEKKK